MSKLDFYVNNNVFPHVESEGNRLLEAKGLSQMNEKIVSNLPINTVSY